MDGLDLSQPYIRNAREIANNQYDTPLCTLSSFASAPADFSQPTTGSNVSSIPTSFPSFSILQYVDQPHELLFMELFEVDSVDSGPAYFQPTGIFEVTRPKPKKKKYKKVDQRVKPVPTTLPEEFRIIREITGFKAGENTNFLKIGVTGWFLPVGKKENPSSFYAGASYLRGLNNDYEGKNAVGAEVGFRWML